MNATALHNEPDLLQGLIRGDAEAFSEIYQWYAPRLYANLLRLVKDKDLAQEFLQDVFMKVWENRTKIHTHLSFRAYLFQISKHLVYDYYRREKIKTQVEHYLSHIGTELHTQVEDDLAYKQSKELLDQAIEKLPPMRKQVYVLCKIEGLSYQQVSEMLNISHSTISDHIVKASKFIREQYSIEANGAILITLLLLSL